MAGSQHTQRDTNSDLATTGGDVEATEFLKELTAQTAAAVNVSISIDALTTERCKFVTEPNKPQTLNWTGGTYTWRWNVVTENIQLQIIEVILRRLSADGATVRASVSSGALVGETLNADRTGTISWNDGSQNPADRTIDDRLEIVYRIQNLNALASTGSVECNVSNRDSLDTPIIFLRSMSESVSVSENILARKVQKFVRSITEPQVLGKVVRSINEVVSYGEKLSRLAFFFRTIFDSVSISESISTNFIPAQSLIPPPIREQIGAGGLRPYRPYKRIISKMRENLVFQANISQIVRVFDEVSIRVIRRPPPKERPVIELGPQIQDTRQERERQVRIRKLLKLRDLFKIFENV